jgi:hypothetical protein
VEAVVAGARLTWAVAVEAVVPAVEGHPDGRDDVPPPLAGVLQRVFQVVQACMHATRGQQAVTKRCCVPSVQQSIGPATSYGTTVCRLGVDELGGEPRRPLPAPAQAVHLRVLSGVCHGLRIGSGWCQIRQQCSDRGERARTRPSAKASTSPKDLRLVKSDPLPVMATLTGGEGRREREMQKPVNVSYSTNETETDRQCRVPLESAAACSG